MDTAYLLRNAATMDELFPSWLPPVNLPDGSVADSAFFIRADSKRRLDTRSVIYTKAYGDTVRAYSSVAWNKNGRITTFRSSGNLALERTFVYNDRRQLQQVMITGRQEADTLMLGWNRAGLISGVTSAIHTDKIDTVFRSERLYDGKNRLVAVTNAPYGPAVHGAFTFEYDGQGRLVRRSFMTAIGGGVLCTDTLIYSFEDSLKLILKIAHRLRIANGEWITIDERKENTANHKLLEYRLLDGPKANLEREVRRKSSLQCHYDAAGRPDWVLFKPLEGNETTSKRYYYNENGQCDSVRTVVTSGDEKHREELLTFLETFTYWPGTDLLQRQERWICKKENGRKSGMEPVLYFRSDYTWSN